MNREKTVCTGHETRTEFEKTKDRNECGERDGSYLTQERCVVFVCLCVWEDRERSFKKDR